MDPRMILSIVLLSYATRVKLARDSRQRAIALLQFLDAVATHISWQDNALALKFVTGAELKQLGPNTTTYYAVQLWGEKDASRTIVMPNCRGVWILAPMGCGAFGFWRYEEAAEKIAAYVMLNFQFDLADTKSWLIQSEGELAAMVTTPYSATDFFNFATYLVETYNLPCEVAYATDEDVAQVQEWGFPDVPHEGVVLTPHDLNSGIMFQSAYFSNGVEVYASTSNPEDPRVTCISPSNAMRDMSDELCSMV